MKRTLVLVDLANTDVIRTVHRPNPVIIGARLDEFLTLVADRAATIGGEGFRELQVRLYDGWFDARGDGTEIYWMVRRHLAGTYPTRRRGYRLFVEIADALLATTHDRLNGTFRIQAGLTRYHIGVLPESPEGCVSPDSCGLVHLRSWVKGRCSTRECAITSEFVAHFRQQKLVDTALVADAVWGGSQGLSLIVVSDDEDVVPGLLAARSYGTTVGWVSQYERPRDLYAVLVAKHGIDYLQC